MTTKRRTTATLLDPAPVSELCTQRLRHMRAKNHLGSRDSGMQGSLDTGTAWPYYLPASRTFSSAGEGVVEFVDAVGGGEQGAREREEREE